MDRTKADANVGRTVGYECDECGGDAVRDENELVVCEDCGLVLDEMPSMEPSWSRLDSARHDNENTGIHDV